MGECWLRREQLERAWRRKGADGVRAVLRRIFHTLKSAQNLDRNYKGMPKVFTNHEIIEKERGW
jgi:hypothetical protein